MSVNAQERCRRLIDLFVVSVLLDAGAGTQWQYKSKESGRFYKRSEGLAVASLEMFKTGMFSSNPENPCQVDAGGLAKLNVAAMAKGLQVTETNPMDGLEGRTNLLIRLSTACQNSEFFGKDSRPGNMVGEYFQVTSTSEYPTDNITQTTSLRTPQRVLQAFLLSRSRPYGTFSWTVLPQSGQTPEQSSMAYHWVMPGIASQCLQGLATHLERFCLSTSLHSGCATRSWFQ